MSGDLRFTSAPSSPEYRDNWDRLYSRPLPGVRIMSKLPEVCQSCKTPLCVACTVPLTDCEVVP